VKRFTPDVLQKARQAIDAAKAAAQTDAEKKRVQLQDDSLAQFELFMKLRHDLNDGRLAGLEEGAKQWLTRQLALGDQYAPQYSFTKVPWSPNTIGGAYFKSFFEATYLDAARVAREFAVLPQALRQWKWSQDKDAKGGSLGWAKADFDDKAWKTTDVGVDTWADLELLNYMGVVWYRAAVPAEQLAELPAGKKTYLWLAATDGSAKVFVNGQHVAYTDPKGVKSDTFTGFCQPASFDITAALQPGKPNQITIQTNRSFLNELGTGGLLGPAYLYHDK
jgi:hypothetical protein